MAEERCWDQGRPNTLRVPLERSRGRQSASSSSPYLWGKLQPGLMKTRQTVGDGRVPPLLRRARLEGGG